MTMRSLKCSRNLAAANPTSAIIILLAGRFFVYALNYGYLVLLIKTLDHPEAYMRYTFTCHKSCTREDFPKQKRMPLKYACNKCYSLKKIIVNLLFTKKPSNRE